jgi:solute:Na+ symporter, SSS family
MTALLMACLLGLLVAGCLSSRHVRSRDEFFVAGRRGSASAIGGSLLATVIGGSATIGVAGLAYERGLTAAWWSLVGAIGLVALGLLFAPRVRSFGAYTLPGVAGHLYGGRVRIVVALLISVAWMGVVSGQIVAASRVLAVSGFGSPTLWTSVFTVVLVSYAVVGGQKAVIRTDLVQAIAIIVGLVVALVALVEGAGGVSVWMASAPSGSFDFPVSDVFGWVDIARTAVLVGSVYLVGPDIYTRLLSARDERTARRAALGAAVLVVPIAFVVAGIGIAASIQMPGLASEEALPWIATHALPPVASFLLLVAMLAALMSSADSTLLGQATVFADDVLAPVFRLDERQVVFAARVGLVILALLSLLLALTLRGVIASLLFAYSIFTSGVVGPMLLGLIGGRLKPDGTSVFAGAVAGGACGLLGAIPWLDLPQKPQLPLVGLALSVALPLMLSFWRRRRSRSLMV